MLLSCSKSMKHLQVNISVVKRSLVLIVKLPMSTARALVSDIPVGSTGCRIIVTLIHAMKKRGNTLGLATLCGGGGVSMACVIEML